MFLLFRISQPHPDFHLPIRIVFPVVVATPLSHTQIYCFRNKIEQWFPDPQSLLFKATS